MFDFLNYPIKALYSKEFYFQQLISKKGSGLFYILILSVLCAIFSVMPLKKQLNLLKDSGLTQALAQLPDSYIDNNFNLSPKDNVMMPLVIKHNGQNIIVYDTTDNQLSSDLKNVPLYIGKKSFSLKSSGQDVVVGYESFAEKSSDINFLSISKMFDGVLNISSSYIWAVFCIYFYIALLIYTLIDAIFIRFIFQLYKVYMPYTVCFKFTSYAITLVALLNIFEMYSLIYLPYYIYLLIPIIYAFSLVRFIKNRLLSIDQAQKDQQNYKNSIMGNNPQFDKDDNILSNDHKDDVFKP